MGLRRVLAGVTIALVSIAAVAGAGLVWFERAPRRTPAGQPALSRLDAATLANFGESFNARADEARFIVLLSPT